MFGLIGGFFDCLLGKKTKIINNQSKMLNHQKSEIASRDRKIFKLEVEVEVSRDVVHKEFMNSEKIAKAMADANLKHKKLLDAEEELILDKQRLDARIVLEQQEAKAEKALKQKLKDKAKGKKSPPKMDDDDLL
jgi:hypothetical protein